ncbi:unnamed protein product [Brassica rapa subsp. trilocularis]
MLQFLASHLIKRALEMGNSHVKILKNKKTIHIKQPPQESDQLLQAGHTPTVIIQFFPELESSVDDNCVGDGRDGVGLGFHRFVVKFCHSDGMTGS